MTSQLKMEANAIFKSRWWNTSDAKYNISNRCNWSQISCNLAGSIININIDYLYTGMRVNNLETLKLSTFHNLEILVISYVGLQGTIPKEIGLLYKLTYLDLSGNSLEGEIPPSLGSLRKLKYLDISNNSLQGSIPHELGFLKHLTTLVLSQNSLEGEIPPSLVRHNSLKNKRANTMTTKNGDVFCIWNYDGKLAYDDIITATEDFDMRYCIGTGAYGSVYKAQLPCGKIVALKKLHGFEAEVPSFYESFRNEYMEKGSLFSVLYDDVEAVEFKWRKRVNIVKGVASALSYLHHDFTSPIVHRDISSGNILLNNEWQPSVSDFGTARLLQHDSSNRTIVAGTIGYIAPVQQCYCHMSGSSLFSAIWLWFLAVV
ncbi:hypothetical protein TSUD_166670 [Trifolium subterraneum]|uniref:non-specific serine/threonine protein kinase n=1 Tax=Trifolium subterraneum TaxID=3900 RepID=A0A2Z6MQT1_TRISU|nr:hypothetical protein TSUD_166670 [Trifolium subterraneum]